jgi:phosphinothricin acetyltransferase
MCKTYGPDGIGEATLADLPAIQSIYAHHVLHGTGTFEEVPPSLEEMTARHAAGVSAGYAWLVSRDATGVLGFAYYGAFRQRTAYRHIVEDSVYVRDDVRGQGVGKRWSARWWSTRRMPGYGKCWR